MFVAESLAPKFGILHFLFCMFLGSLKNSLPTTLNYTLWSKRSLPLLISIRWLRGISDCSIQVALNQRGGVNVYIMEPLELTDTYRNTRQPAKILFVLGVGTAFSLMGDATLYVVLPTHAVDAGVTLAMVGILLGVNRAVRLVFNTISGWLYDHFSQQRLFLLGLSIGAFSTVCYAFARGFWLLLIGRVFWGMAWSLIWVGGGLIVLNFTTESQRGRRTGFYQTWFFLGGGIGAFVGGVLTDLAGYYSALRIIASIQICSVGLVFFLLPTIPKNRKTPDSTQEPQLSKTYFSRDFCLTTILQGLHRFCISGILMATLGLLVKERIVSPDFLIGASTITGLLVVGRTLISMFTAPLAGHLSDVMGNRWRVITYALFIGFIAMILLALDSAVSIVIGVLGAAIITSSVQSLTITLTGDLMGKKHRGKAISLLYTAGDLGSAIGPPCAYVLLFRIGLTGIYLCCAGLFLIAFCLVVLRIRLR